jgi:hypothetical protein
LLLNVRNGTPTTALPVVGTWVRRVWGIGVLTSPSPAKTEPPMLRFWNSVLSWSANGLTLRYDATTTESFWLRKPLRVPLKTPTA